jgi:hypothetical protein
MNTKKSKTNGNFRIRMGMILMAFGLLIFLVGAVPDLFGLDRSPVIGFVQIAVFLIGLAIICVGGYICLNALWNNHEKTILADIGLRLVSTGFVIAVISGMADIFGFGTQLAPEIPYYGPWQSMGVLFGEIMIMLGFLFQIPFQRLREPSDSPAENQDKTDPGQINLVIEK